VDEKLGLGVQLAFVGQTSVSDFIESIRRVRNKFSKENFFVGVEGVDDQAHQLVDFSLELKGFNVTVGHFVGFT
jgi:hypothetical protein